MIWNEIKTAPLYVRVLVQNEMWGSSFGEVQIAERTDATQWEFDSGMNITELDEFDKENGITLEDYQPQGWLPLPPVEAA